METAPLKSFATWARTELITQVSARIAAVLAPASPERTENPRAIRALETDIVKAGGDAKGKDAVADKVAYTWFNRIIALRFMDANGYTNAGVVSPVAGQTVGQPEVLADAKRGTFDPDVVNAKIAKDVTGLLDGTRSSTDPQGEAYTLLLAEYSRFWNKSMPFMFEREGDYTELLIPSNLLADESVLTRAVTTMTSAVCKDVEVIGWLYQFYISERKDEVFAAFQKKQRASAADIPAATQLFTPHWIVRYLVENSVGRLWMLNHPESRLVDQMDYYIAPVDEETDFLKLTGPEELTVIDPACGSGHMLTYAFDLLFSIYEEEGYSPSEIPSLILVHNLYGVEIDPRAGALAAFALTMKARARQRAFLAKGINPNICVIEAISFDHDQLDFLVSPDGNRSDEEAFWNSFTEADTLGSLVQPGTLCTPVLKANLDALGEDLITSDAIRRATRVIDQARYLSQRYCVVVANPPYMGSANMSSGLEDFIRDNLSDAKADLFAAFIDRAVTLAVRGGLVAMIAKQNWLFRPTFAALRSKILSSHQLEQVAHFGAAAFDSLSGEVASTAAFVLTLSGRSERTCWFARLTNGENEAAKDAALCAAIHNDKGVYWRKVSEFLKIPGAPVCYWISDAGLKALSNGPYLGDVLHPRQGLVTGDNARYLRLWWEVSRGSSNRESHSRDEALESGKRWYPYNKGGGSRRWYGHDEYLVDWYRDGNEIQTTLHPSGARVRATNFNLDFIFKEAVSWSDITTRGLALRYSPPGFLFDATGLCAFPRGDRSAIYLALAFVNSTFGSEFADLLNPTHHFKPGDFARLPLPDLKSLAIQDEVERAIDIARDDWQTEETAPGFAALVPALANGRVSEWVSSYRDIGETWTNELWKIEQSLQDQVAAALGNTDGHAGKVDRRSVTLRGNAQYMYGSSANYEADARRGVVENLVSYSIGCIFGRYGLDKSGLILADQASTIEDYLTKVPRPSLTPDVDNVIPVVDGDWFEDDIVARFREFLRAAFGVDHFEENLRFIEESLGVKSLRDYFITRGGKSKFYEDHVKRYKKRPIYWMFSSPKGSFNALIYMHRYTPSTVSTVLNEYLREYEAKLEASLHNLEREANSDSTPRQQAAAAKEAERLRKILVELSEYEHEVMYPLASEQIAIDLDDGVKSNYPKFGSALKKIQGL